MTEIERLKADRDVAIAAAYAAWDATVKSANGVCNAAYVDANKAYKAALAAIAAQEKEQTND
jgi:hypothetical protein